MFNLLYIFLWCNFVILSVRVQISLTVLTNATVFQVVFVSRNTWVSRAEFAKRLINPSYRTKHTSESHSYFIKWVLHRLALQLYTYTLCDINFVKNNNLSNYFNNKSFLIVYYHMCYIYFTQNFKTFPSLYRMQIISKF